MSAVSLSLLLLSASICAASLSPAVAQSAVPAQQATAVSPDAIKQREEELEATREQQRKAAELQQKLKADIAAIGVRQTPTFFLNGRQMRDISMDSLLADVRSAVEAS